MTFWTPPLIRISRNLSVLIVRKISQFPPLPPQSGRLLSIAPIPHSSRHALALSPSHSFYSLKPPCPKCAFPACGNFPRHSRWQNVSFLFQEKAMFIPPLSSFDSRLPINVSSFSVKWNSMGKQFLSPPIKIFQWLAVLITWCRNLT